MYDATKVKRLLDEGMPYDQIASETGATTHDVARLAGPLPEWQAVAVVNGGPAVSLLTTPTHDVPDGDTFDEFWSSHEELTHIRDFARARRTSPWAVLGVTLARVVCQVEPSVGLPALVGKRASLNLFVGLVGESGAGKGAAEGAAEDALLYDEADGPLSQGSLGSGEGLVHAFMAYVPGKGGQKGRVEQHTTRHLFSVAEVDTIAALKTRQASTLMPEVRKAYSGEALGFSYANKEKNLNLPKHRYRLALVVGIQPLRAQTLLEDQDGGTPQRFLWLPTTDPDVPEVRPDEPTPLPWSVPALLRRGKEDRLPHDMEVCQRAAEAIDRAAVARNRGQGDPLDGHALLTRLKTAAALALLLGSATIDDEHWDLAGVVMAKSNATRGRVIATLEAQRAAANKARGKADGVREAVKKEVVEGSTIDSIRRKVLAKLSGKFNEQWVSHADLRRALSAPDRAYLEDAIDGLIEMRLVDLDEGDYKGQPSRRYRYGGRS